MITHTKLEFALISYELLIVGVALLMTMVFFDVLTGFAKGVIQKNLQSGKNYKGYVKKLIIIVTPWFLYTIDLAFNFGFQYMKITDFQILGFNVVGIPFLSVGIIVWFILGEALSIIENLALCGVPMPSFITKVVKDARDNVDAGKNPFNK